MANNDPAQTPVWLELIIDRAGDQVRISALGSRGEQVAFRPFGVDPERLGRFAATMERAAKHGQPLTPELLADAHAMYDGLTDSGIGVLLGRYAEAAHGPLLVRFSIHDDKLQAVPWEAVCNPLEKHGFWGVLPNLLPVRTVISDIPWNSAIVEGAVRILTIAPTEGGAIASLKASLTDRIQTGEVQWLEPLEGANASKRAILQRLRQEPAPHVLHFVGHGRMDGDVAALRVADEEDEEAWLDVESLAQEISANLRGKLQLVILEACETARQTTFASAAEIIAQAGVEAVVAHTWPVRANIARLCSTELYRTLAGTDARAGNIAMAMNDARRAIQSSADGSAETMSPVLYLRGPNGAIFNFENRKLTPVIVAGVGAAVLGVGAIVAKTTTESTPSVADVVRPEPVSVEPTIPDKPMLESSTGQQTHDAPLPKVIVPKETPPPKLPRSNPPPAPRPRMGPEPHSPHTPFESPPIPRVVSSVPFYSALTTGHKIALIGVAAVGVVLAGMAIARCSSTPESIVAIAPSATTSAEPALTVPESIASFAPTGKLGSGGKGKANLPAGKSDLGRTCAQHSDCKSTYCVDGVCCDSLCKGACRACSLATGSSADGACKLIAEGKDPSNECGSVAKCNGQGACKPVCSPKAPCAITQIPNGGACTTDALCQSGFCVDGVCCESSCEGLCRACSKAAGVPRDGVCRPLPYSEAPSKECPENNRCNGKGSCSPIPQ